MPPSDDIAAMAAQLRTRKGARILVVDDNPMNRQVATQQLAKLGFACDLAENGRAALSLATSDGYDLILCDCQMPEMDGYDFTRSFRRWERAQGQRRTPIIALTAHALQGDAEKCADAGMDGYVSKPVKIARIAETLRTWLPGEPAPTPPASGARMEDENDPAPDVDLGFLAQVLDDDAPAAMAGLLSLFAEHFETTRAELEDAISARDFERAAEAAHAGKGMARNAAAMALGDAFAAIEELARKQTDWPAIVGRACAIPSLFAAVLAERDRLDSLIGTAR
ncbi:MAG: response regulator [Magnetospirillum sp.]|nr:response regulator [Magnetospirillum sp.]